MQKHMKWIVVGALGVTFFFAACASDSKTKSISSFDERLMCLSSELQGLRAETRDGLAAIGERQAKEEATVASLSENVRQLGQNASNSAPAPEATRPAVKPARVSMKRSVRAAGPVDPYCYAKAWFARLAVRSM